MNETLTAQAPGPAVLEPETDARKKLSPQYRVLIHNDDITPMDFVVHVLMAIFRKNTADAFEIMLAAHTTQIALVGVLPLAEAVLRVDQAHALARAHKFPLTFTYEPA